MDVCGSTKSNNNCSVVGCNFTYKNCPPGTKFFSFPNEKQHGNRRKAWIIALRRGTIDRKPWTPTKHSRVCSRHFINGTPTRDPDSPGYIPRLHMLQDAVRMRQKRRQVRSGKCKIQEYVSNAELPSCLTTDASTQTEFSCLNYCDNMNILFCSLKNNCDAEVQTGLPLPRVNKQNIRDGCLNRDCGVQVKLTDSYSSIQNNEEKLLCIYV